MKNYFFGFILLILFACEKAKDVPTEIQMEILAEGSTSWIGDSLPPYPEGTPQVSIMRAKIPPQAKLRMHKHPVINAGVLIKGTLTVISDKGDTLRLKAGDPIIELVNRYHFGMNEGDEVAEIIVVYAGEVNTPITIAKED